MVELFRKYLDNQCTPEEVKALMAHFDIPANEALLRRLITDSLENVEADDNGSQWYAVTNASFDSIKEQIRGEKGRVVSIFKRTWFRVAAAVLLVGGFAVFYLVSDTKQKQEVVKTPISKPDPGPGSSKAILTLADGTNIVLEKVEDGTVIQQGVSKLTKKEGQLAYTSLNEKPTDIFSNNLTTPRGGQFQLILSDGSKVWLNAASSLSFPAAFTGNERRVKLEGEAYFEISKNASMPFKVQIADKAEVEVIGTHFNVYAYTDETIVKATLLEGRVKVISNTSDAQILQPGEQAIVNKKGLIKINKDGDTDQAVAWKDGIFNFNNADLDIVLRQLARWYDVDIVVEGSIPKRQFNGEIQRDLKLSQVLKLLEKNNVSTRLEGNTLFILVL